jgi:hypothetical protein
MHGSRSKIPSKNSRPYTYDVKFLALLEAPYIYDISRLRVKLARQENLFGFVSYFIFILKVGVVGNLAQKATFFLKSLLTSTSFTK